MPILIPSCKLLYFPVPKSACTSLKHAVFAINNGFYLRSPKRTVRPANNRCSIHEIYVTRKYSVEEHKNLGHCTSFAVIRDPMERILSAFSNRVLHHGALDEPDIVAALKERGLPTRPDINQFILNLGQYRKVSMQVLSHTRPLRFFLGTDFSRYDRIFTIQQMSEVARYLSKMAGREIIIPRFQTGGDKQELDLLTDEAFDKLRTLCLPDYETAKDYLAIPER